MSAGLGFTTLTKMAVETCCNCGMEFHVPAHWQAERRALGDWFFCPNGHRQHYTETEAVKLKRELAITQRQRDEAFARASQEHQAARAIERRRVAQVAATTRLRRRVKAGACPCCKRTFRQLAIHMKKQHPDWEPANCEVTE